MNAKNLIRLGKLGVAGIAGAATLALSLMLDISPAAAIHGMRMASR